ncbi:ComF family protein [Agarivorans sp. JK6]|uniref:ComF family protein n=1 Tax=Agarivorans sp. JK6 TaxID=2997426 RepID=UPI003872BE1C
MLTRFHAALNSRLVLSKHCDFCFQSKRLNQVCCDSCSALLLTPNQHRCETCYLPLAEPGICGECQGNIPFYDQVICLSDYQWPIEPVIKAYKYAKQQHLAKPLGHLIWQHIQHTQAMLPDVFCPVPLHWFKQWQRGFNQSEVLCKNLAKHAAKPMQKPFTRKHYGSSQAGLTRRQRQRALAASFSCQDTLNYKHWVIVDDVVTTGSTANVLARQLKDSGAERVDIWAIARTPKPSQRR